MKNKLLLSLGLICSVIPSLAQYYENYGGGYDYGNQYGGNEYGNQYDHYSDYGVGEKPPQGFDCFACSYHVTPEHNEGMEACNEPMQEDLVPTVKCYGHCGISIHRTGKDISINSFLLVRNCFDKCVDKSDDDQVVSCCRGDRCNGNQRNGYSSVTSQLYIVMFLINIVFFVMKT